MKLLINILFFLSLLCPGVSCKKDFLSPGDTTVLIREDYINNLKSLQEYLDGTYYYLSRNVCTGNNAIYPDLIADNVKPGMISTSTMSSHYQWSQQADESELQSSNMNYPWMGGYSIIRSCNFIIEKAEEFKSENTARANDIKGQALVMRALVHHWLVNVFAQQYNFTNNGSHPGIPYVKTSDYTQPATREAVDQVYENLVEDLNSAITLLPDVSINKIIISRNAAKALLARVYLFKNDFQKAKNLAAELSLTIPIMNSNYPSKLFTTEETEAIFQRKPEASGIAFAGMLASAPYVYFLATSDVAAVLREFPGDKRSVWVKDTSIGGPALKINKFPVGIVSGISPLTTAYYNTILRSSEQYLIASEAYAKLNNEDSARYYLNEIRTRAGIPAVTNIVSGNALLDSIYKERRREFCFEGFRMFDLLRTKKDVIRIDVFNNSAQTLTYPSDRAIAPIPLDDVTFLGMMQNPSY